MEASHFNSPLLLAPRVMFNVAPVNKRFESWYHLMVGSGYPSAEQVMAATSSSVYVDCTLLMVTLDGESERDHDVDDDNGNRSIAYTD